MAIVARLTPPGKAAIACLGVADVEGGEPLAWEMAKGLFRRKAGRSLPVEPIAPAAYFGTFGEDAVDEVILSIRNVQPLVLEIHCHGGLEVIRSLEAAIVSRGIAEASSREWAKQIHGCEQAEMLDILTRCSTVRTADIALDQLNGAFERTLGSAAVGWERLAELVPVGEHLARPWKVVVAGAPNVGKSSLVNALAGFTRSVVSPTPGTTRDAVATQIALDGWPIELVDTAGLRETTDTLEAAGIARAEAAHADADLVLWVLEAPTPPDELPADGSLVVVNKIDQPAAWDLTSQSGATRTSAVTNEGIAELARAIVARLIPDPPKPSEAVPITLSQRDACLRFALANPGRG